MQQPIRTPRAPAVARLVASAHRKNREEARSSGGPPRRIPPNFPVGRSPLDSIRTLNWNSFLEPASSCLSSPISVASQFLEGAPQAKPEVATVISS